jgi:hypothetical protein
MDIYQNLPKELINKILSYSGVIQYRNGVYMNQIPQDDERYQILREIRPSIYNVFDTNSFLVELNYSRNKYTYFIEGNNRHIKYSFYCITSSGIQVGNYTNE